MTQPYPAEFFREALRGPKPKKAVAVEVPGVLEQLIINTPEHTDKDGNVTVYNGETYGVKFNEGQAIVSSRRPHKYGYSINRLAWLFLHDSPGNYEVEIVYAPGGEPVTAAEPIETEAQVEPDKPSRRR